MEHEPKIGQNNVSLEYRALGCSAYDACGEHALRGCECEADFAFGGAKSRRKRKKERKMSKKESFFMEFAAEIDLFALQDSFPEWVYDYREAILNKVDKGFRVMCQFLKDSGVRFYVKYPIEINGKWKYADAYLPDQKVVVLLLNDMETIGLPCHSKTDREIWFSDKYRTVGINRYEVNRTAEIIKRNI